MCGIYFEIKNGVPENHIKNTKTSLAKYNNTKAKMKQLNTPVIELNFKVNISYNDEFIQDSQQQDTKQLMFIFWGILIPIIALVGIIGNTLTILVLWRREMKSTTIYFLRTLVITDMGIIVGGLLGLSIIAITQSNPAMWRFNDVVYPHIFTATNYMVMTLQMINVWVTVAVTVERYIAICLPFRSVRLLKKRNAFIIISIVIVVSLLYNVPRCFAYEIASGPCEHGTCYSVISSEFGKTSFFTDTYSIWLYLFLIYIFPFVILSVLNVLLIIELMNMRTRRLITNERESSETNMAVVLVLIVVVFIICQTPGLLSQFQFFDTLTLLKFMCISNTLFILNSSVNFLIYTAVGKKFRKVLLKTFHVFKRRGSEFSRSFSQATELSKLNSPNGNVQEIEETDENSKLKRHG